MLINFLIGAIGFVVYIKKKKPSNSSSLWIKFAFYFVIVFGMFFLIRFSGKYLTAIFSLLIIWGIYEIFKITFPKYFLLFISTIVFIVLGYFFIVFSILKWEIILWVYIVVVTFDGFCQIVGQLFGKNNLIPKISPNKTVEGLIGGFVLTFISSYFFRNDFENYYLIVFALMITSLLGDILASYLKRLVKVKDYSKLIPGHGGILDRFDSFIFTGALVGLYFQIFNI